jgi:hypothetical protein
MIWQIFTHMIQMVERFPKKCGDMHIVNRVKDLIALARSCRP